MAAIKIEDEPTLVKPLFELSGKLLNEINRKNKPGNVIMSPVSIHQALSMVLLGSNERSQTKREILDTLGYSNMSEIQVAHCHQEYSKLMSDFVQINENSVKEREEYEKKKKEGVPEYQLPIPKSPILEMFTMMVTKNMAKADPTYEQDIKRYFHSSVSNIDDKKPETKLDLLKKLNDWAEVAGFEGPIMDSDYLDAAFAAILLTAIRVEGFWFNQLEEGVGKNIFYNDGNKDNPVDGMFLSARNIRGSRFVEFTQKDLAEVADLYNHMSTDEAFNKLSGLNFRAADIPLEGNLSFALFEPVSGDSEKSTGAEPIAKLNKLVEGLFSSYEDGLTNLAKALELLDRRNNNNEIDYLRMPKFKFESDIDLKPILEAVGLMRVFNQLAEISHITSQDSLYIGDIKHKAFIESTKSGIKAAAVTMIRCFITSTMKPPTRIKLRVENPFMFVLRYQKMPLFVGQLTNLNKNDGQEI